ncbi:MAG: hypothetical protein MI810_04210 [Flavobacteriales bacterium]|nr:hypothetical protein [Flavobacteriales bacterium]
MKVTVLCFLLVILNSAFSYSQTICDFVDQNNFEAVDRWFKNEIKSLNKNKEDFKTNEERLDSLISLLQTYPCIQDAYRGKSVAYILTTTHFYRNIGVQFKGDDELIEKCFKVRTYRNLYYRKIFKKTNSKLIYHSSSDCDGFIDRHREIDNSNSTQSKINRHNGAIFLSSRIIEKPPTGFHNAAYYEGQSISVELFVENRSDTTKKILWPIHQNTGKKIIYFELLDESGNHLLTEDREILLPSNENILYDILTLAPGEKKSFVHTFNGDCKTDQQMIECHHNLGVLQEGNYQLKVWYDPFVTDVDGVWHPLDSGSIQFRYEHSLVIKRSLLYTQQLYQIRQQADSLHNRNSAQRIFKVKALGANANYYFDKGTHHFDAFGQVQEVKRGAQSLIGDTIAFSLRYTKVDSGDKAPELLKQIQAGNRDSYWIYVTHSEANYYQIKNCSAHPLMKGKRNYQLVNFPNSIEKAK